MWTMGTFLNTVTLTMGCRDQNVCPYTFAFIAISIHFLPFYQHFMALICSSHIFSNKTRLPRLRGHCKVEPNNTDQVRRGGANLGQQ